MARAPLARSTWYRGAKRGDREGARQGAHDDEEADSGDQAGNRGADERMKEAVHRILSAQEVVHRLAVDQHLGGGKRRPGEDRGGDGLERETRAEVNGVTGN